MRGGVGEAGLPGRGCDNRILGTTRPARSARSGSVACVCGVVRLSPYSSLESSMPDDATGLLASAAPASRYLQRSLAHPPACFDPARLDAPFTAQDIHALI